LSKYSYDLSIGHEDHCEHLNQELLITNCYEEINEHLVNDIGNWPFVEEEVAEFNNKLELPNKIPEDGRKIELKCSLPWKKIFNMSKTKKKKNKTKKVAGLELGPAKVEVRLRAPSAEWKVISDYHENATPVVKVSRLILQRESDISSYSEKDSEEENENRKHLNQSPINSQLMNIMSESDCGDGQIYNKNVTENGKWQPIVLLTRNKELDKLTKSLESQVHSEKTQSHPYLASSLLVSDSTAHSSNMMSHEKDEIEVTVSSSESEGTEYESDGSVLSSCLHHSEESACREIFKKDLFLKSTTDQSEHICHNSQEPKKNQSYETYSPSGYNNGMANETAYSPSDPHFSPEFCYPDSDPSCKSTNIDSRDEVNQEIMFVNNKNYFEGVSVGDDKINSIENKLLVESDQEYYTNVKEIEKAAGVGEMSINCGPVDVLNGCSLANLVNNSLDLLSKVRKGKEIESLQLQLKNALNNDLTEEGTMCGEHQPRHNVSSSEESFKDNKKSKRKMPKNFFVRKKLRKIHFPPATTGEVSHIDNGSLSERSSFSPCYDPVLGSVSEKDSNELSLSLERPQHELLNGSINETYDNVTNSESDSSVLCENTRLHCVYDLEDSSHTRLNETPLMEKCQEKQRLRDGGRGIKRPCEGHSREDTKRRRDSLKSPSNTRCQDCHMQFEDEEELSRHNAYRHARRRELHHCLLCQRSFSSAVRHSLHVQGRSHRHLELTQRHTMHTVHRTLVGGDFPHIPPLSEGERQALEWRPAQAGYTHFYHDPSPLQRVLEELNSDAHENTSLEERTPND